jgi:YD repeat-containing protein
MTVAMVDRIEIPPPVASALDLLTRPHELSPAGWAVRSAVLLDRRVDDDESQQWVEAELQVLEAVERVKAWADLQGLAALRRLREAVGEQVRMTDDLAGVNGRSMPPQVLRAESDSAAVDEVVLATGLPQWQVERRLDLAVDADGRGQLLTAALAEGRVSLDRAIRLHHDTRGLGTEETHAICQRLLAPNRDGSIRTDRSFRRELRRQVALHTPDPAEARDDAVAERCAYASLDPGGTGCLTVIGESGRVAAAMERVDDVARRLRGDGDTRTLTQLRSDVALDLLLYGWADAGDLAATPSASSAGGDADQPATDDDASAVATFVGRAPAARVTLVVSLGTLLGEEGGVGEIPGYGYVSGEHARQLATARGSVWRRLVSDPVTGAALDLTTYRYRPTPAMANTVAALDGVCTAPGCTTAAHRCDIDHNRPWPAGPTAVANLSARDRRHHNHKTRGTWTATTDGDGTTLWQTCSARSYLTGRNNYDDPLSKPVTEAELDAATSAADGATTFDDPPPY